MKIEFSKDRQIIDISPVISPEIAVFPGDTPFREEFVMDMKKGDGFTLSNIQTTVHLGAHTDAPIHYSARGESIETRPLDLYLGAAQVIEVKLPANSRIRPQHLGEKPVLAERVLFKTGSFPNPNKWRSDFVALSSELVEFLAAKGVRLVGIDTPSIDPAEDKVLESHSAVLKNNMGILEGIVLDGVAEGVYQLVALPLKMAGADASPVRAVLIK